MDMAFLRSMPRMVCCAPADALEMEQALDFALRYNGPVAVRYPRDAVGENLEPAEEFRLGKSRSMREGKDLAIIAYGERVGASLEAAELLAKDGIETAVINARFAKPLDGETFKRILGAGRPVLVVEDHAVIGGLATAIQELAGREAIQNVQITALGLPDSFLPHGSRGALLKKVGLDAEGIRQAGRKALLVRPTEARQVQARIDS